MKEVSDEQLLKQLRHEMWGLQDLMTEVNGNREAALAFTALQIATMHVGNTIKHLDGNNEIVYPESTNTSNEKIEDLHLDQECADLVVPEGWDNMSEIVAIKALREVLGEMKSTLITIFKNWLLNQHTQVLSKVYVQSAMVALQESKNWLGMRLGKIRDEKKRRESNPPEVQIVKESEIDQATLQTLSDNEKE